MYGSTDMNRLRTRICPSARSGWSASVSAKLAAVGQPVGREARTIWRGIGFALYHYPGRGTIDVGRGAVLPYRRESSAASEDEALMIRSTMQEFPLTIPAIMRH